MIGFAAETMYEFEDDNASVSVVFLDGKSFQFVGVKLLYKEKSGGLVLKKRDGNVVEISPNYLYFEASTFNED